MFNPQRPQLSKEQRHLFVIPVLGRQRQADPWVQLAGQSRLIIEFPDKMKDTDLIKQNGEQLRKKPKVDFWPPWEGRSHTCTWTDTHTSMYRH